MQAGSPSAYSAFTVNRHHTSIKQACECEIILFELMDNQTGTQFRFEPGCLGRHDITGIGNIDQLLHRNRVQSESHFHLAIINTTFQFSQSADTSHEINPFRSTQILNIQNVSQYMVRKDCYIQYPDRSLSS